MSELHEEVSIRLINDKVRFTGVSSANPDSPVSIDYVRPWGTEWDSGGLNCFFSASGCSATTVVALLRKMGKTVTGFEVRARECQEREASLKT